MGSLTHPPLLILRLPITANEPIAPDSEHGSNACGGRPSAAVLKTDPQDVSVIVQANENCFELIVRSAQPGIVVDVSAHEDAGLIIIRIERYAPDAASTRPPHRAVWQASPCQAIRITGQACLTIVNGHSIVESHYVDIEDVLRSRRRHCITPETQPLVQP